MGDRSIMRGNTFESGMLLDETQPVIIKSGDAHVRDGSDNIIEQQTMPIQENTVHCAVVALKMGVVQLVKVITRARPLKAVMPENKLSEKGEGRGK
jgi:hypothetical protein